MQIKRLSGNRGYVEQPRQNHAIFRLIFLLALVFIAVNDAQSLGALRAYTYDGNNNLVSVQEQSGGGTPVSSEYGYDAFDRLTRYQSPFGETVTYSYDPNGNRTALISSGGHASRYTYDRRNRLSSISNRDGETTYSWRRNDQLSRITYSHGGSSRYEYDGANRLTSLTHQAFGGEVARYTYEYDPNGNRTRQVENNGQGEQVTTYTYDSADRLTGVTYPDQSASYSYDAAWNRISETLRDLTENTLTSDKTLGYNGRNQLISLQDSLNPALNATYSYDANGNQIERIQGTTTTEYAFDARNHLRSITTDGSPVGSFLYDYRGLRLQKQAPAITRYTHDDQSVLFQSDASGSVTHRFEYGPDRLLSLKPATQASEFYLLDALNSPIALVRGDGTLTARYSYDAWGNKRQDTGTSSNPFGFTGHEHDSETGLIYAKARYYDPETARFLSQDPWAGDALMPPSLNKYLYAYQNPTVYVDPDGRQTICRSTAADGSTIFGDCGAHGAAETQIVRDPGGEEAARRRALEERTAALQETRRAVEEGERVRQVGTNALCGTNSAPAHCVQGLPPRQVTVAESDVAPNVMGIDDIEQQIRSDHERIARLAAVIGPGLGILEVAMPGRAASGTAGEAAGALRSTSKARAQALLDGAPGINFSSRADAVSFRHNISGGQLGAGTPLTDFRAIEDVIGPIPSAGNRIVITKQQAVALEDALGLPTGRVSQGGVLSVVEDVSARAPRSPVSGNQLFLGGGQGLPGGGPEINIAPINTAGGGGIRQIILQVE